MRKNAKLSTGKDDQNQKSSPMTDEEYFEHVSKLLAEWEDPPESLTQEEYDARLAAQIVEWEEHPEVYERWLRAHEPSKLWKELRAIKCKFMGLPYSDLDLE